MKTCNNCGCANDNINRYCRNCGSPFEDEKDGDAVLTEENAQNAPTDNEKEDIPFFSFAEEKPEEQSAGVSDAELDEAIPVPDPRPYIDFDFGDITSQEMQETDGELEDSDEKVYSTHAVINIMKSVGASMPFLFMCIFFSVSILGCAVAWVAFEKQRYAYKYMPDHISDALLLLPVFVCAVLCVVGFWVYFASCSNRKRNCVMTGGLSAVRAASIIAIVWSGISEFYFLATMSLAVSLKGATGGERYDSKLVLLFLICAALVLLIIYYAFTISTVNSLKKCAATGAPAKLSVYIIVMNYVFAALLSPGIGFFLAKANIAALVATVSLMLALICLSGVMISYRSMIKEL